MYLCIHFISIQTIYMFMNDIHNLKTYNVQSKIEDTVNTVVLEAEHPELKHVILKCKRDEKTKRNNEWDFFNHNPYVKTINNISIPMFNIKSSSIDDLYMIKGVKRNDRSFYSDCNYRTMVFHHEPGTADLFYHQMELFCNKTHIKHIIRQVTGTLCKLHAMGIVHLDIKLENIVWNPKSGKVSLIDFEMAQSQWPPSLQLSTLNRGTPKTMPPEQIGMFPFRIHADRTAIDVWQIYILIFILCFMCDPFQIPEHNRLKRLTHITGSMIRSWFSTSHASQCQVRDIMERDVWFSDIKDWLEIQFRKMPDERMTMYQIYSHPLFQ